VAVRVVVGLVDEDLDALAVARHLLARVHDHVELRDLELVHRHVQRHAELVDQHHVGGGRRQDAGGRRKEEGGRSAEEEAAAAD